MNELESLIIITILTCAAGADVATVAPDYTIENENWDCQLHAP